MFEEANRHLQKFWKLSWTFEPGWCGILCPGMIATLGGRNIWRGRSHGSPRPATLCLALQCQSFTMMQCIRRDQYWVGVTMVWSVAQYAPPLLSLSWHHLTSPPPRRLICPNSTCSAPPAIWRRMTRHICWCPFFALCTCMIRLLNRRSLLDCKFDQGPMIPVKLVSLPTWLNVCPKISETV